MGHKENYVRVHKSISEHVNHVVVNKVETRRTILIEIKIYFKIHDRE